MSAALPAHPNPQTVEQFFRATQTAQLETVRAMVQEDPTLARVHWYGLTALMCAVQLRGSVGFECVKTLLPYIDAKARGNWKSLKCTPLMYAASWGHVHSLRLLLPLSEMNAVDDQGFTALMHAVSTNNEKCVQELLAHHDWSEETRRPALMWAVAYGNIACARLLVGGSNVDATSEGGETAFEIALEKKQMECADLVGSCRSVQRTRALWAKAESLGIASPEALPQMHAQVEQDALMRSLMGQDARALECDKAVLVLRTPKKRVRL